ncbi:MAG: (2Fe-2S) ferredoxin domain-containing protein [Calditrichaeota bacterium]|nr:MAG: (2Fe-2S) ferredoxin domain-containing protein [Calditrichota bacterium]
MEKYEKHIFVCVNERTEDNPKGSCFNKNSLNVFQKFRKEITTRDLKKTVCASKSGCLASCSDGPTVVVYPEGVWYKNVSENDVAEILEEHILGDRPVERLRHFPT